MAKEIEFKETELKLRCAVESLPALAQLLDSIAKPQGARQLNNTYFDTSDIALAQAKAALRIREKHGQYEQTLKTRGKSVAGLQQRGEWNWPIASNRLDIALLQQEEIKLHLPAELALTQLYSIFTTNFQRHTWLFQQGSTLIEVAIDNGAVKANQLSQPLCECELELMQGEESVLWQLAQTLGAQTALWISDISKAERGYRLANLGPSWHASQNAAERPEQMLQLQDALVHWQRALEVLVWENTPASVATVKNTLQKIMQLAEQLKCSELIKTLAPWITVTLTEADSEIKNNKTLALSVQKAAFAYYQLLVDQNNQ